MIAATPAQLDALKLSMARELGAVFLDSSNALERDLMVAAVEALRGLNQTAATAAGYLMRNPITVGPLVYLAPRATPDEQLDMVCRQVQHVVQWRTGAHDMPGGLGMFWLYLTEPEARVRFEVDAIRAALEVHWARARALPTLDQLAAPLDPGYLLGPDEISLGRDLLEVAATSVRAGVVSTSAGASAVAWMRREAAELLAA